MESKTITQSNTFNITTDSKKLTQRKIVNRIMLGLTVVATIIALIPLFSILYYVLMRGLPAVNIDFFTSMPKPVGETGGGMANAIGGSFIVVGLSCLIGIPIGIMGGIFLSEYGRNKFGKVVGFLTDVLLGAPSIVVGIVVYVLLVITMGGFSAIAGAVALAILMIPAVARSTYEMLRLIPSSIREAGLALGLPKWRVIVFIIFPSAFRGILTGVLLAVARVSGETAPLLFTAAASRYWSNSLTDSIATLPVMVYNYAIAPYEDWQQQAWAGALTLITMVLVLNVAARLIAAKK